jgi:hypothetical protein
MNILIMFLINNTTAGTGYGNFTSLVVIFLMVQTQSYLVLVLAVPLTLNIGKSGLTIIKMELLKLLKK